MRVRPSTSSLVGALVALVAACADAPSEPVSPLAPRAAAVDLLGVDLRLALSASVVVGGTTFAKVEDRPGGWVETFNVNFFPDTGGPPTPWTKPPAAWLPDRLTAADPIASNYLFAGDATRAPNSLPEWAIVKHVRDRPQWYVPEPMHAWHEGTTCAAPPATHPVLSYDESPFLCRNHMMTAVTSSGYAVTYLTPNRLVNFASLDAVVRFDVATLRSSARDWIDLWITPYEDNLVVPLDDSLPDVQGHPANGLHVRMSGTQQATRFEASWIYDHRAYRITPASTQTYEAAFAAYKDAIPGHSGLPSATRRDTFELHLSAGRLRFGMPRYNLWWIDTPVLSRSFGTSGLGVVQLGHHSFAPATDGGTPDTWHWDNVGMAPAVRFSIINADRRYVDQSTAPTVQLARAAPNGSRLRFAGYGSHFQVRFNGGSWQNARRQAEQRDVDGRFHSYWTSVPTGTTRIEFRASNDPVDRRSPPLWMARDISVWSLNP